MPSLGLHECQEEDGIPKPLSWQPGCLDKTNGSVSLPCSRSVLFRTTSNSVPLCLSRVTMSSAYTLIGAGSKSGVCTSVSTSLRSDSRSRRALPDTPIQYTLPLHIHSVAERRALSGAPAVWGSMTQRARRCSWQSLFELGDLPNGHRGRSRIQPLARPSASWTWRNEYGVPDRTALGRIARADVVRQDGRFCRLSYGSRPRSGGDAQRGGSVKLRNSDEIRKGVGLPSTSAQPHGRRLLSAFGSFKPPWRRSRKRVDTLTSRK